MSSAIIGGETHTATMAQDRMDHTSGKIPLRTHWIPRFLAAGVDYFDLQDLLRRIDRWEVWCREWSAKAAVHEKLGREALDQGRLVTAGQALGRVAAYYQSSAILNVFLQKKAT